MQTRLALGRHASASWTRHVPTLSARFRVVWSALAMLAALVALPAVAGASPWVAGNYVGYGASMYPPSAIDFASLA